MKSKLDYIESRLQALIENSLAWLPWRSRQPHLAEALIDAIRNQVLQETDSDQSAANILHIFMNPANTAAWQAHPEWQDWLLKAFSELAQEADITFYADPELSFKSDPGFGSRDLRLIAAYPAQEINSTAVMATINSTERVNLVETISTAFLIVQGKEPFPLDKPVINIGRRYDNHLVIDDMRVSRSHAQIRRLHETHKIFDLNSSGGTYVNGNRITQHTLITGDVISFAGVTVIYGQEEINQDKKRGTSPAKIQPKENQDS